ncbi:microtubule-binding protein TANGLED1 [Elaeis guineensis]|uniref:Microtubule-binding protein TANGLED1 n=1 Tax=Elaeis guineensis var. tenera TaxID=51953 RepID=A0A6I9RIE8_ELAGV|nr:microtubule-binding protein TANGLED1 [Elaeis guineensis]
MVAKTPTKEKRMAAAINPILVRETVKKVDRCMARLQELQYTVTGGAKVISGVSLSPRSTRGYLRTSLRCKQETLRMKNPPARKSPTGKFPGSINGEWRRMSLPAMLIGETVVEILQASHFAKEVVAASAKLPKTKTTDPKTPDTIHRNKKLRCESSELRARRMKEKQVVSKTIRPESGSPRLTRARSRIRFKSTSPLSKREDRSIGGRTSVTVNRVSPKNKPWAKKAVLFPNPLFLPSSSSPSSSNKQSFYRTKSPIIGRTRQQIPHKFIIKSPPTSLKLQLKSKKAVPAMALNSPTEKVVVPKARRCSFSPSKLASRLVSPIRTRISLQKSSSGLMSGLKQRPNFSTPVRISSTRRI